MYVRVTTVPVQAARFSPLISTVREKILPLAARHDGFLGGQLLTRTRINKALWQTTWRTEFDAQQADKKGLLAQEMELLAPFASGTAYVEGFEVSVLSKLKAETTNRQSNTD